jgi:hypothetical protein
MFHGDACAVEASLAIYSPAICIIEENVVSLLRHESQFCEKIFPRRDLY